LNCRPKNYCIEISDNKNRLVKTIKIENEDNNTNLSDTINLNELGKYIELKIFDNYGGEFIIIKRIYFYINTINIIKKGKDEITKEK